MEWETLKLTAKLAFFTTIILIIIGFPLAYWLATCRKRWKIIVEAMVALPLILPPTVLGYYLLVCMSPNSWIGRGLISITGQKVAFSFTGILIASVLYNLPFMMQPLMSVLSRLDKRLLEASWCLGQSKLKTMFRIVIPLCGAGIINAMVLTFSHTVGEFGVVLMIGGNIPEITRTLSISVYDNVQSMDYAAANQISLFLITFAFITLLITYTLQRRLVSQGSKLHA
jgi:molybdate transport system permease protein